MLTYSVIYEFSLPFKGESVTRFRPPRHRTWDLTECADGDIHGIGERWKQRKYCKLLSQTEMEEFVNRCELHPTEIETLGSLGAPGYGIFWSPAIYFQNGEPGESVSCFSSAYVTPNGTGPELARFMEVHGEEPPQCLMDDRSQGDLFSDCIKGEHEAVWPKLRRAVINHFMDECFDWNGHRTCGL